MPNDRITSSIDVPFSPLSEEKQFVYPHPSVSTWPILILKSYFPGIFYFQ